MNRSKFINIVKQIGSTLRGYNYKKFITTFWNCHSVCSKYILLPLVFLITFNSNVTGRACLLGYIVGIALITFSKLSKDEKS